MDEATLAGLIDHTNLYPDAHMEDLAELCAEAEEYGFASVCVYGAEVERVRSQLGDAIDVAAVAGFHHGRSATSVKAEEAREAVEAGADEIDVVINQGHLKDGRIVEAVDDLRAVREAVPDAALKVICENCNLDREEKVQAYRAAEKADADFIKTSTGFGSHGARVEDVELMAETLEEMGSDMGIKASGGIGDAEDALEMLEASGMDPDPSRFRIGASSGVEIVETLGDA
jgi:deoxyribose-phosphate aldolase